MMAFEVNGPSAGAMLNPRLRQAPLCYRRGPVNKVDGTVSPVERLVFLTAILATAGFVSVCLAIA